MHKCPTLRGLNLVYDSNWKRKCTYLKSTFYPDVAQRSRYVVGAATHVTNLLDNDVTLMVDYMLTFQGQTSTFVTQSFKSEPTVCPH